MEKTNTLKLNHQTQNEILHSGLKLDETIAEINKLIANYGIVEEVNYIDITYNNAQTGLTSIYLINYSRDESGNQYFDYLEKKYNKDNDGAWHPFKIKTHLETNEKKYILNYISFIAASADFKKCGKPENGYILKELSNNKPNTLLSAKNKNFVCFFAVGKPYSDSTPSVCEFNMNEEKQSIKNNYFNCFSSWNDATRSRIEANKIFACYNSNICNYWNNRNTIIEKQRKREQFKKDTFSQNRYLYNNADYQRFLHDYYYIVKWWNVPQCELTRTSADNIDSGSYIEFKGLKIYHGCTTRPQLYNYLFDKNGFCKLENIYNLRTRAENLRKERQQQKYNNECETWENADKSEQIKIIDSYIYELNEKITTLLKNDLCILLNDYHFSLLKQYRELYNNIKYLLNFDKFATLESWNKEKEETIKKYDFYITAINRGKLGEVACFHQYDKTESGYKMKDQYLRDPHWGRYYAKEF